MVHHLSKNPSCNKGEALGCANILLRFFLIETTFNLLDCPDCYPRKPSSA